MTTLTMHAVSQTDAIRPIVTMGPNDRGEVTEEEKDDQFVESQGSTGSTTTSTGGTQ